VSHFETTLKVEYLTLNYTLAYIFSCEDEKRGTVAAKALPDAGTTLKTTTYAQVLPANEPKEKEQLNIWEYVNSLKEEEYGRHICYVYRWLDNGDVAAAGKLVLPFDEFTIQEAFGGGSFRLILKKGPQICKRIEKVVIEGKPKDPEHRTTSSVSTGSSNGMTELAMVMQRQTDLLEKLMMRNDTRPMVDEAMRGALDLQRDGFRSVVSSVRELTPPAQPATPTRDPLMEQLLQAAIAKLLNPADPIQSFAAMATAFKELNLGNGGNTSVGVELVRAVGSALPQIANAVTSYTQAQLEAARLQSVGGRPALPAPPQTAVIPHPQTQQPINVTTRSITGENQPGATTTEQPQPAAATPAASQAGVVAAPNVEWIETIIARIIMNPETSATEAASEALTFLQNAAPGIRDQLVDGGQTTIEFLFNSRPILMQVPKNPRLTEFIAKFLEMGSATPMLLPPANSAGEASAPQQVEDPQKSA
jgi:hypothetical protein